MAESMAGKTVVITGASSGIGLETARALAGQGARIVMVVRSKQRGEAAIASIRGSVPEATLELVLADLYSMAEVRQAGAELRQKLDRVDVLEIKTPSRRARDDKSAKKLWEISEQLCGVTWS